MGDLESAVHSRFNAVQMEYISNGESIRRHASWLGMEYNLSYSQSFIWEYMSQFVRRMGAWHRDVDIPRESRGPNPKRTSNEAVNLVYFLSMCPQPKGEGLYERIDILSTEDDLVL